MTGRPVASVLLVTDSYHAIARVIGCLTHERDLSRVELVVSVVRGAELPVSAFESAGIANVHVVEGGDGDLAEAEHRAVLAASAPVVVFAQAHAYPKPGFLETIITAAERDWTVLGPSMTNATPDTPWSRAAMWIDYGRWLQPVSARECSDVPGHNSAYRREALLALGDALPDLLEAGWPLQVALKDRGGTCVLQPAASVAIVNPTRMKTFVRSMFATGRSNAARRCRRWALSRRLFYAAGSPLVPLVRLARTARDGFTRRHDHAAWTLLPHVAVGLVVSAAGECVGYLAGKPRTVFTSR